MNLSQKQIAILGGIGLLALVIFVLVLSNPRTSGSKNVTLKIWGTFDNEVINQFKKQYKSIRPNVELDYSVFPEDGYEEKVTSALAAGEGPDVFMIPSKSLYRNKNKLYPAPAAQFSLKQLREQFPTVVEQDFADQGVIYALPLYVDTLALFYNRGLLDKASLVRPPQTWEELRSFVPYLRILDEGGHIVQAAAAIGGSEKNVPHAADILLNMILQNSFSSGGNKGNPEAYYVFTSEGGLRAMNSYIQFTNSAAPEYTWNDSQPNAYESFGAGKTAIVFGYRKDALELKRKHPFLDMGIALMPQFDANPVTYSNYWGLAVSRQSKSPEWGWDFIINFTTNLQIASMYTETSGLPPALRSLIGKYLNHAELGTFAKQALTARSLYRSDDKKVDEYLNEAISGVLAGRFNTYQALQWVQNKLTQLRQN